MKPDPRPRIYKTKVSGSPRLPDAVAPISTPWCRRYHRAIASSFRTWFNRPSDAVRPTTRSPEANRGRHRLREVVMTQALHETSSTDGCYRAYGGVVGSSP